MATVPRRLTFGAHATAYERARPAWPEPAARWLVPAGAELVVELGAGTREADACGVRARHASRRSRAGSADARGAAGPRTRRGGGHGRGDSVRRRSGRRRRGRLQPPLVRARAGAAGDPPRPAAGRPLRLRLEPPRRPAPAIARMGETVYAAQARRPGPRWRSRDWAAELTDSGLFRDVEHALFEHVHEFPREALADHLLLVLRGRSAATMTNASASSRGGPGPRRGSVGRRLRHPAASVRRLRLSRGVHLGST